MEYDVAVVGAGAAGLIAARTLRQRRLSVAVFEARNRLGGRILGVADPGALAPVELGPEFVHGRPESTATLLAEYGATVVDNAETSFVRRDGRLVAAEDDPFEAAGELLARALDRDDDESVDALIARVAGDPRMHEAADWTRRLVAGFDAADPAEASARAIAREWAGDASAEGSQSRPLGGYAPLVAHLAGALHPQRVHVRLQTVVDAVERDETGVRIHARGLAGDVAIHAKRAIVTVPAAVLAAEPPALGAIRFAPALPPATRAAIDGIATGPVIKVVLRFRTPFWETLAGGAWRDGAFFSGDGPFPTYWTQLPVRANTLVAWAGGPRAAMLPANDDERIALALAGAGDLFDDPFACNAAFVCGYLHDWQRDPFSRGAYTYLRTGAENAREALAVPVDDRLWFAGEATANRGEGGTVAGALESGIRAAAAVAESLGR